MDHVRINLETIIDFFYMIFADKILDTYIHLASFVVSSGRAEQASASFNHACAQTKWTFYVSAQKAETDSAANLQFITLPKPKFLTVFLS